jgi:hypothetical protein
MAGLIVFIHSTGKATAGHGDADDAANCKSPMLSRFDASLSAEASEATFDIKKLGTLATVALHESVRLLNCDLLDTDTFAIVQQDFEMRLCEWRALNSGNDNSSPTNDRQVFVAYTAPQDVPPSKASFIIETSAIESAIQIRPWGYRFTRDNLLSSYQFSSGLRITNLDDEEYRPYDFFEVPEARSSSEVSELPVVAEVSSIAQKQSPNILDEDYPSIESSHAPVADRSINRYFPINVISDSIAGARTTFTANCANAFDHAKEFVGSIEFNLQDLLIERLKQSTPALDQMSITIVSYAEALRQQHWLTNGIKMAIGWNSPAVGPENARHEASRAVDSALDSLIVHQDLRRVFGASVLADPFAADCSLAFKRPPTLASPEMIEMVANRAAEFGRESIVGATTNRTPGDAWLIKSVPMVLSTGVDFVAVSPKSPEAIAYDSRIMTSSLSSGNAAGKDATAYELLVLLQNPSWMADAIESNFSEGSAPVEIGLSKIDEASAEPKSASLTPENAGIGVSQR